MKKQKNNILLIPIRLLFSRFTLALLSLAIQCLILFLFFFFFEKYIVYYIGGMGVLSCLLVIYICNKNHNVDFNISWVILILAMPTIGALFYLFCKLDPGINTFKKRLMIRKKENKKYLPQNKETIKTLLSLDQSVYSYANYLYKIGHFPVYEACNITYFKIGEEWYQDLLKRLQSAQKYIFLEFFIIANDKMWNRVLDILKQKAKEGIEVRILYDGTCSFMLLKRNYPEELAQFGIKCQIFAPIVPVISTHYNNRDHRKIVIIDGIYAYTGGANMANEYINDPPRFRHWKDTMLGFSGSSVQSFIVLFLEMWNLSNKKDEENYNQYFPVYNKTTSDGFLIPFGDDPFDNEQIGEQSYIHLLNSAKETIDIIMPYFIVDQHFFNTLLYTAKRGVKIRLLLPGIADKKMVNYVAKTYYKDMLQNNIEIYEYKGFTHAKMMIRDTLEAIIGTINLDYRSLYLHFEDAVYLYQNKAILAMKKDYEETLLNSKQIFLSDLSKNSLWSRILGKILRMIAPLL